jgi:hypothetical protein
VTKIYTYCLFDGNETFCGVYSSLKAVHRDAIKICNNGNSEVLMRYDGKYERPSLTSLRNILKGRCDVTISYISDGAAARIVKTKLRE